MMKNLPKEQCTGCSACVSVCPKQCIRLLPDSEGFLRPEVDETACINCSLCEVRCPVLHAAPAEDATQAFAAYCTDESVRMVSTSGGIFTLLAQWIFDRGGVVFGAAYNQDFEVVHCGVEAMEELQKLRTAKYAQSRLEDSFSQVEQLLKAGRYVLFSGTPCQTEGLRAFLHQDWDRLMVVDVVCHGVPSPAVWRRYIDYRHAQDAPDAEITAINLRSKDTGWPGYSIRFDYSDGTVYCKKNNEDPFLRGFVGDLYLRPSCYTCPFKGISRHSDFTLADYWGVWSQHPELDDGKGISVVLVHSDWAKQLWEELASQIYCLELDPLLAVKENPSAISASAVPEKRKVFWLRYNSENFESLVSELLPLISKTDKDSLLRRGLRKMKRIIMGE